MTAYRNILVAFDATEASIRALDCAIELAAEGRARLTILTAAQPVPYLACVGTATESVGALRRRLIEDAALDLDCASKDVPEDIPVTKILTTDPIRPALQRTVAEGCYDLVVMGSRRRSWPVAMILGSVSRFAVRQLRVPVLVCGAPAAPSAEAEAASPAGARTVERLRHA